MASIDGFSKFSKDMLSGIAITCTLPHVTTLGVYGQSKGVLRIFRNSKQFSNQNQHYFQLILLVFKGNSTVVQVYFATRSQFNSSLTRGCRTGIPEKVQLSAVVRGHPTIAGYVPPGIVAAFQSRQYFVLVDDPRAHA